MSKLTTADRNKLPSSEFAGPGRSFPIPDKSHAVQAERMVGRSEKAGNISSSQAAAIKAKAKKKLGKSEPMSGWNNNPELKPKS